MMTTIQKCDALEVLDSRGFPTLLVRVLLDDGSVGSALVPSGASTGSHEALEKRDGDTTRFLGKGVLSCVEAVRTEIHHTLQGRSPFQQATIDELLIALDGTDNKSRLGANALLGTSMAVARAAAASKKVELYEYLGGCNRIYLPCPMFNVINGGAHADNGLDFQEFMIRPHAAPSFKEAIRWSCEVYQTLKKLLKKKGYAVNVGDEGGFAPDIGSNEECFEILVDAICQAGYQPGSEISLAIDCAASEFFDSKKKLYVEKKKKARGKPFEERTSEEQIAYLGTLLKSYPIDSIEDGLSEEDWASWKKMTKALSSKVQIVGDDIFVTNPQFLERGIEEKSANAILIKLNQIGTVTETIDVIERARRAGWRAVVSHRSGETEDSFIADLVVAFRTGQLKSGAPCRSERTSKFNRLLLIEYLSEGSSCFIDSNCEFLKNS